MKTPLMHLFMVLLLSLAAVSALEIRKGEEIIIEEAINESLYAIGGSISVDESVNGDIVAFGGSITINGPVQDDLVSCGGQVSINSAVGGTLHACGGSVTINSVVGGDLMSEGGSISVNGIVSGDAILIGGVINVNGPTSGDFLGAGGSIIINGPVAGDVAVTAGKLTINGVVSGDVTVEADELRLGKNARIMGNLNHTSRTATLNEDQVDGWIFHGEPKPVDTAPASIPFSMIKTGWNVFWGVALLLVSMIIVLAMPGTSRELAGNMKESPLKCLLYGFMALILVPIAALAIAGTIIGIPIAIIVGLLYALAIYLSKVFAALYLGQFIIPKSKSLVAQMALGVAAYLVLANLPFIGGLAKMLALLLGLGTIAAKVFTKKAEPVKKTARKKPKKKK